MHSRLGQKQQRFRPGNVEWSLQESLDPTSDNVSYVRLRSQKQPGKRDFLVLAVVAGRSLLGENRRPF